MNITEKLFQLQDKEYREFHCRLMPTVPTETVIGVRTPELRKLAKELYGTAEAAELLNTLPHKYYEENNLHGFLLERIKEFDEAVGQVDRFLPYVNNWATCDLMSPKIFAKHLPELYEYILKWISGGDTYAVRFGIEMLMSHFLGESYNDGISRLVAEVSSDEYYINMMRAWYFATALAKRYDDILPYIEEKKLDVWTHNKSIQKAIESYRITPEQKTYLRTLKIKNGK